MYTAQRTIAVPKIHWTVNSHNLSLKVVFLFPLYVNCTVVGDFIKTMKTTSDFIKTMKTTSDFNFDLYQAVKEHGYTET